MTDLRMLAELCEGETLGTSAWTARRGSYDRLVLAKDGDTQERQFGAEFQSQFPNYEALWRYHVCPATRRPIDIDFLDGVGDVVARFVQTNYSVFLFLVEASQFLEELRKGNLGERRRNCYLAIICAGNSMQLFTEMQEAVEGPREEPRHRKPSKSYSSELAERIKVFPDWGEKWSPTRRLVIGYRNYLTHAGVPYVVQGEKGLMVVSFAAFKDAAGLTWTGARRMWKENPSAFVTLPQAVEDAVAVTFKWLNDAYGRMKDTLDPLLTSASYQRLWGWSECREAIEGAGDAPSLWTTSEAATRQAPAGQSPRASGEDLQGPDGQ